MKYLFDSNILIYHLNGQINQRGGDLITEGLAGVGTYSSISKIEILGFNQTVEEERKARLLLSRLQELPLTNEIVEETIQIRKARRLKLPDAAIAATAIVYQLTIVTRNTNDFSAIIGLNCINPFV